MLDQSLRTAILKLADKGCRVRAIARALKVSREVVRAVIQSGSAEVPRLERAELCTPYHDAIVEQYLRCKGNLVRVHEEILAQGAECSYQALTAYCRRHGIGADPELPAGHYDFAPGQEMQHDTSPHEAEIGGRVCRVHDASLVLCYSRMIFVQGYPRFTRFECKVFLTDALDYFGGACGDCMIDNTHVVVLHGTGKDMVPVPEMAAFAERYGFTFKAHEKGDANRSARVEGPMDFIDCNFLAGRTFRDWADYNREAVIWCDKVNAKYSKHLKASRRQLFAAEVAKLKPLPLWVPEVYRLHQRIVDADGNVSVNGNRYSAPYQLIGRAVEVRETKERIVVYLGPREVAVHARMVEGVDAWVTDPAHRPPRGAGRPKTAPPREEEELLRLEPQLASYVAALKQHAYGRGTLRLRQLLRLLRDYPRAPFLAAVGRAAEYGLFDLGRLERLVLREVAAEYFVTPCDRADGEDDDDER
jgi:transposase